MSQQGQCMQELAFMFHWASMARRQLHRWQAYTHQQLAKKQRWVSEACVSSGATSIACNVAPDPWPSLLYVLCTGMNA